MKVVWAFKGQTSQKTWHGEVQKNSRQRIPRVVWKESPGKVYHFPADNVDIIDGKIEGEEFLMEEAPAEDGDEDEEPQATTDEAFKLHKVETWGAYVELVRGNREVGRDMLLNRLCGPNGFRCQNPSSQLTRALEAILLWAENAAETSGWETGSSQKLGDFLVQTARGVRADEVTGPGTFAKVETATFRERNPDDAFGAALRVEEAKRRERDDRERQNKLKQKLVCTHCSRPGHTVDRCWAKHPELKKEGFFGKGAGGVKKEN